MADHAPTDAEVFRSPLEKLCQEYALVLRAVGIRCRVLAGTGGYLLVVAAEEAEQARAELDAYTRENPDGELTAPDLVPRTDGWAAAMCYGMVILAVAACVDRRVLGLSWFDAGKASAAAIRDGEWWRTITQLTLHADRAHLIANLVIGGLFGLFAARLLGSGLAWLTILLGGAAGNALNAWLRPDTHSAVGASTAIFAALGIIAGWAWTHRQAHRLNSLARWTPLIGGVVLLGFLGGGGERVDVGAHILGFFSGIVLGATCGKLGFPVRLNRVVQVLLALGAVALVAASWALALRLTARMITSTAAVSEPRR